MKEILNATTNRYCIIQADNQRCNLIDSMPTENLDNYFPKATF